MDNKIGICFIDWEFGSHFYNLYDLTCYLLWSSMNDSELREFFDEYYQRKFDFAVLKNLMVCMDFYSGGNWACWGMHESVGQEWCGHARLQLF